jgi:hypothetical protein
VSIGEQFLDQLDAEDGGSKLLQNNSDYSAITYSKKKDSSLLHMLRINSYLLIKYSEM